MEISKETSITVFEGFQATYEFLLKYKDIAEADKYGYTDILSWMATTEPDNMPIDPVVWADWLECIKKAKNNEVNIQFRLSQQKQDS